MLRSLTSSSTSRIVFATRSLTRGLTFYILSIVAKDRPAGGEPARPKRNGLAPAAWDGKLVAGDCRNCDSRRAFYEVIQVEPHCAGHLLERPQRGIDLLRCGIGNALARPAFDDRQAVDAHIFHCVDRDPEECRQLLGEKHL